MSCFMSLAVDPLVEGKTRAEQFYKGDDKVHSTCS